MGVCKAMESCGIGMVYWPQNSKCYQMFTRGPCANGKLLITDESELSKCQVI